MNVTSVSGHIFELDYPDETKSWVTFPYVNLLTHKIIKSPKPESKNIVDTLQQFSKMSTHLILWLDCDREGEAIAMDVADICKRANYKLIVSRAHFSALTKPIIEKALNDTTSINIKLAESVFLRQELDLRIGCCITRYQSILVKNALKSANFLLISYGPCQIPTLGFLTQREIEIREFKPDRFYYLELIHEVKTTEKPTKTNFKWNRRRIFNSKAICAICNMCLEADYVEVISCFRNQTSKFRPLPMNSVRLEKMATKFLKISSSEAMTYAEKLYSQGYISYPRTETESFVKSMDLNELVQNQITSPKWGRFATQVLSKGVDPRNGAQSDESHPPIHPLKYLEEDAQVSNVMHSLYELIVRHFLACVSRNATGFKTVAKVKIDMEEFTAEGLEIQDRGYLEVYPYENWTGNIIGTYKLGERFIPTELNIREGTTEPPSRYEEPELIGVMDKNKIGTDATIHEHIKTIQDRGYAVKENYKLVPTKLGMALIESYIEMNTPLYKPHIRAVMEADMTKVANGEADKISTLNNCVADMIKIMQILEEKRVIFTLVFMKAFKDVTELNQCINDAKLKKQMVKNEEEGVKVNKSQYAKNGKSNLKKKCNKCGKTRHGKNNPCDGVIM